MPLLCPSDTISEPAARPKSFVPPAPRRRGTLLIVDDEEGPRQSLRVVFKSEYDLLIATDGESAISLAKQNQVDVAILDIRMVGMSGIELLEKLKAVDPKIEVIMLTAYETIDTIRQALRLGASDYLNKPFDISTIRSTVAGAMERRSFSSEVHTNTEKLRELQDELQEHQLAAETLGTTVEIYASIIHEINSPLTVISALIQSLDHRISHLNRLEGDDLEMVKDRLKRITRQVSLCIEISRRYLNSLRATPAETHRTWINQILADLGQLLQMHPAAKGSQLVIVPLAEDADVSMNSTDLVTLLLNLVINALQSTPQSHRVEVRAEVLTRPLKLDDFRNGPQDLFLNREEFANCAPLLALSVQDSGPGIPPEVLPRIFDPYFSTRKPGQGTGLGLTIVQRFTKQARGAIHVHSKIGHGSVFTVYLPLRSPAGALELKA